MQARHITTGVTLVVLLGVLAVGAVVGWQQLFAELPDEPSSAEPSPTCATQGLQPGQQLRSSQVRVSVYNAGTRAGLATSTLQSLESRGFEAVEAGNAPDTVQVRRVQVWSTRDNDAEARLVARQFGRRVDVRVTDQDLGPGVDVVIGNRLEGLRKAPRSIEVTEPESVCVPVDEPAEGPAAEPTADESAAEAAPAAG